MSEPSSSPAPLEDGAAPDDLMTVSRLTLVQAMTAELLDYFPGSPSGDPKILESEARWIASEGVARALRAS